MINRQLDAPWGVESLETPIRVLLAGSQWDGIRTTLTALANQGGIAFVGPAGENLAETASRTASSVIMVSPGFEQTGLVALKGQARAPTVFPSVLLCVTHEALERDDWYDDLDDFLLVPCTVAEMRKRIGRLVRRMRSAATASKLAVGKIALNLDTYQVTMEGRRVDLAWMEFQLLKFLMQNPGRVFTREQLLASVWGVDSFGGTRTVDVHIRRLRSKLGSYGDEHFRTVKNVGYGMAQLV